MFNLKAVEIENFRSFKEKTRISIDNLTTIIGKNDIGKSTILEALEIFFNNEVVKIDINDVNVFSENKNIFIKCIFENVNHSLILDEGAITNLKDEYLLNSNNELELLKVYDTSKKSIKPNIYINALYPVNIEDPLINLTQAQLQRMIKDIDIKDEQIKENSNVSMRSGIYRHFENSQGLTFEEQLIHLSKQDGTKIWNNLSKKLPIFALFQADRQSKDDDNEVQDPMKLAVKQALMNVEDDLTKIKKRVKEEAMKTANKTLEKLHEMDKDLASELTPEFLSEPKWDGLFKLSLDSENGISINKRGSGVRRLILLNFFRAEVDRQRDQLERGVIYAIEEPETAQHPNNQKMLVESLKELAVDNCQVMITTHVPGVAELLPVESIRFINDRTKGSGEINTADESQLDEIAEDLGVIPSSKVKLILHVEGKNDVIFLKYLSKLLYENGLSEINLFKDKRVAIIPTGGVSNLKDFVNKRYLRELGLHELYIVDKDSNNKIKDTIITKRREMENYIHHRVIKDYLNKIYPELEDIEWDIDFENPQLELPKEVCKYLESHKEKLGSNHPPREDTLKNWLNAKVTPLMNLDHLKSIGAVDGVSALEEVRSWFQKIEEGVK